MTDLKEPMATSSTPAREAALTAFLSSLVPGASAQSIRPDTPLLSGGLLDSLGILQLVGFLSDSFGIDVADDDFTEENFATVQTLLAFIDRKLEG